MSQQATRSVTPAPIDLRPPQAAVRFGQQYLVDEGLPTQRWVYGYELLTLRPPVKVAGIAWRL